MIQFAMMAFAVQAATFDAGRLLPIAAGNWTYAADANGSSARFANQFLIRCDRGSRRVTLNRLGVATQGGATMTISTDTQAGTYAGPLVALGAFDPMLDALAFTRGRFLVDVRGSGKVALPFQPELARSIEDCRN